MHSQRFMTRSLEKIPEGKGITRILDAAIQAVDPGVAVNRHLQRDGDLLSISGMEFDMSRIDRVLVIGAGKAAFPMLDAAANVLGNYLSAGIVIVKEGYACPSQGISCPSVCKVIEASHPVPDQRGVDGTQEIITLLKGVTRDDLVICLFSGGSSALLLAPYPEISLSDYQTLTDVLLASGADISEVNTIRKHIDQVKGGRLAEHAAPASVVSLILSDVVGDRLDVIASGPTVPDLTSFSDACRIIERRKIHGLIPQVVISFLQAGEAGKHQETPKPSDSVFDNVHNFIIG